MGVLRKKSKHGPLPAGQGWTVAQAERGGKPLIVRSNLELSAVYESGEYAHRLGVAIPLLDPTPNGLPTPEEDQDLGVIEERLEEAIESNGLGHLACVLTTNGMREFLFYVNDSQRGEEAVGQVRPGVAPHQLQHYVASDPDWVAYREFVS